MKTKEQQEEFLVDELPNYFCDHISIFELLKGAGLIYTETAYEIASSAIKRYEDLDCDDDGFSGEQQMEALHFLIGVAKEVMACYQLKTKQRKPYRYSVGMCVINKWNFNCEIVERKVNNRGTNIYIVKSNEDAECDGMNAIDPGATWDLAEYEIRSRD